MYFYAYLQKDQTINAEYYFKLLCQLQEALKETAEKFSLFAAQCTCLQNWQDNRIFEKFRV